MRNILSLSALILLVTVGSGRAPVAHAAGNANSNQVGISLAMPTMSPSNNPIQATPTTTAGGQPTWPVTAVPLKVSAAKATPTVRCLNPYTVRSGDTLSRIALRCGVTVANLRRWNNLRSDIIWVGQRLFTRPPATKVSAPIATPRRTTASPSPASPDSSPIVVPPTPTPVPVIVEPTAPPPTRAPEPTPVPPAEPTPTPRLVPTVAP
jgi:LysM repeat protein